MVLLMKINDCVKCLGPTVINYDGKICLVCGKTDYSEDPEIQRYREHKKKLQPKNRNVLSTYKVSKNRRQKAKGNHSARVMIVAYRDSMNAERMRYEMECPYSGCREVCIPRNINNSKEEKRYRCTVGHVWYLVIEDHEPLYWR